LPRTAGPWQLGSGDRTVSLWDTASGIRAKMTFAGQSSAVTCVVFSPDGKHNLMRKPGRDDPPLEYCYRSGRAVLMQGHDRRGQGRGIHP
jgi:WD40 repeat protein